MSFRQALKWLTRLLTWDHMILTSHEWLKLLVEAGYRSSQLPQARFLYVLCQIPALLKRSSTRHHTPSYLPAGIRIHCYPCLGCNRSPVLNTSQGPAQNIEETPYRQIMKSHASIQTTLLPASGWKEYWCYSLLVPVAAQHFCLNMAEAT